MDLSRPAGPPGGITRSYSNASKTSASRATIDTDTSSVALLLPDSSQLEAPRGIVGKLATRTDGSQFHTQRLSSTERSRVLKSTIKLRRILGESLDEEVIRQWVVLPKQMAERKMRGGSSLPVSTLDYEPEEGSTASSISADESVVEWQRRRRSAPLGSHVDEQSSPVQPSIEKSITMKRSAKLYSMLGERVDVQSPGSKTRSGIRSSGSGKGVNATLEMKEIDKTRLSQFLHVNKSSI